MTAFSESEVFGRIPGVDLRAERAWTNRAGMGIDPAAVDNFPGLHVRKLVDIAVADATNALDTQGASQPNTEGAPMTLPPDVVTRPCACGLLITASRSAPFAAVSRHNRTPAHRAWALEQEAWGEA